MTRINCVPVSELSRQHLVAEYRELPRVFNLARKAALRGHQAHDAPPNYTLGKGHVLFFYTRLSYLATRQQQLIAEMIKRGYQPNFTDSLFELHADIPAYMWNDWTPDQASLALNRQRILERSPSLDPIISPNPKD